MLFFLIYDEK